MWWTHLPFGLIGTATWNRQHHWPDGARVAPRRTDLPAFERWTRATVGFDHPGQFNWPASTSPLLARREETPSNHWASVATSTSCFVQQRFGSSTTDQSVGIFTMMPMEFVCSNLNRPTVNGSICFFLKEFLVFDSLGGRFYRFLATIPAIALARR